MPRHFHQRGLVGIVIVVTLVLVAGLALIQMQGRNITLQSSRNSEALIPFTRIQTALLDFARINKRLPCPANPLNDTGVPQPINPTATCSNPDGTVPFAVLGLSANDVLDPWGRKISYRVWWDSANSATVFEGLDRSQCDSIIVTAAISLGGNGVDPITGFCKKPVSATPRTLISNLGNLGLTVKDNNASVSGVAYVLISHGETGRGSYLPGGQRLLPLPVAGSEEELNTGIAQYAKSTPDTTVDISQIKFYDDIVVYEKLKDIIDKSGLKARDWPDIP